jgi:hypothetical protein
MFVARKLINPTPDAIKDLKLALESIPARAGEEDAALVRIDNDKGSNVFLVRAPGAADKSGKITLQTDKGVVEGYALETAKGAVQSLYERGKGVGGEVFKTAGVGFSILAFEPWAVPMLESMFASVGLPPAIARPAFFIADALISGAVMLPGIRASFLPNKSQRLANAVIDANLADKAETLNVVKVDR